MGLLWKHPGSAAVEIRLEGLRPQRMVIHRAVAAGWVVGEGLGCGVPVCRPVLARLVRQGQTPETLLARAVLAFLGRGAPEARRALQLMPRPRY